MFKLIKLQTPKLLFRIWTKLMLHLAISNFFLRLFSQFRILPRLFHHLVFSTLFHARILFPVRDQNFYHANYIKLQIWITFEMKWSNFICRKLKKQYLGAINEKRVHLYLIIKYFLYTYKDNYTNNSLLIEIVSMNRL